MRKFVLSAALLLASTLTLHAQQTAITSDNPPDKANPAKTDSFQLPSHGEKLNALMYIASGAGPHPVVILLHGFPGNERNLDLAQAMRRAGYDVLYFNYRGSWGSPGDFSFTHCLEDVASATTYLRNPANATRLRANSSKIILIGHSMGGFMAYHAGALDPAIRAIGGISASDLSSGRLTTVPPASRDTAIKAQAKHFADEGMSPLAGTSPEALANEVFDNSKTFSFPSIAPKLAPRPMLIVTSDDGLAPVNDQFATDLKKVGEQKVTTLHLPTDHVYSEYRIALETAVLQWLATIN